METDNGDIVCKLSKTSVSHTHNVPVLINSMLKEIPKTAKTSSKSSDLNKCLDLVLEHNDNPTSTLYSRNPDKSKATNNQKKSRNNCETINQHEEDESTTSKLNVANQPRLALRANVNNTNNVKPPFLYEHYPLRPALLYGNRSSFTCDSLKHLQEVDYIPHSLLQSTSSSLFNVRKWQPMDRVVSNKSKAAQLKCTEKMEKLRNFNKVKVETSMETFSSSFDNQGRLKSGQEDGSISLAALQTKQAYAQQAESAVKVCSTCQRKGFSVTRTNVTGDNKPFVLENLDKNKISKNTINSDVKFKRQQLVIVHNENKQKVRRRQYDDVEIDYMTSSHSSTSGNSIQLDYNTSLPIFEVLNKNYVKNYANQPALKHKDSLIFYRNNRRSKECLLKTEEVRKDQSSGFVRFFDEVQIECKPSDQDIVFGNTANLNSKLPHSWKQSRIDWLTELERRQEVLRRRQRRSKHQYLEQDASDNNLEKCSYLCRRIRLWLAKWIQ